MSFKKVLSIFNANTNNIGDDSCYPALYFNIKTNILPLTDSERPDCDIVIVGGGAILNTNILSHILEYYKDKIIIGWGLSYTIKDIYHSIDYSNVSVLKYFKYLSVRDINISNLEYVPCVSCLSNLFDKYRKIKPEYKYVYYDNILSAPYNRNDLNGPLLNNNIKTLEEAIRFLSFGEIIITSSYHGMYWGTLLNRKIIVTPFGSKFYNYKYKPIFIKYKDIINISNINNIPNYPNALKECRDLNISFLHKIKGLLK